MLSLRVQPLIAAYAPRIVMHISRIFSCRLRDEQPAADRAARLQKPPVAAAAEEKQRP
jgi:hypothetical protein